MFYIVITSDVMMHPWHGEGWLIPRNMTLPHVCYRAEIDCSRSNHVGVQNSQCARALLATSTSWV